MRDGGVWILVISATACSGSIGRNGAPTDGGPADGRTPTDGAPADGRTPSDGRVPLDTDPDRDAVVPPPQARAELWYTVEDMLVHVELNTDDGTVREIVTSSMSETLSDGQNAVTMLDDGSLIGSRLSRADELTHFYFIADPPRDGSMADIEFLGVMPDAIMLEGLYTDCDGRLYGMDTGTNDTSSNGNRLLRFTGDYLAGDFTYIVISDLATASVVDIDDMSPGITDNVITDNPGLAIDTGTIHSFNFETGFGTAVGTGGTFGIHALGSELFDDGVARIYVLASSGDLYGVDPGTFDLSDSLGRGPVPDPHAVGWSGIAGPLTDCETGFIY